MPRSLTRHPELPFAAYRGDAPYAFVSYSHADARDVYRELQWLRDAGVRCWYDEGIEAGHDWAGDAAEAIDRCAQFVVFLTPQAVESQNVTREILYALDAGKPVVPVHLVETELPKGLKLALGDRQAILRSRRRESDYRSTLLAALGDAADAPPPSAPAVDGADRPVRWGIASAIVVAMVVAVTAWFAWFPRDAPGPVQVDIPMELITDPPGVLVSVQDADGAWMEIGHTPVIGYELPHGVVRLRMEGDGVYPIERTMEIPNPVTHRLDLLPFSPIGTVLDPITVPVPAGTIRVPRGQFGVLPNFFYFARTEGPGFFIDRHEVSNADFQRFVDAGGYEDANWWRDLPFELDGAVLEWKAAVTRFTDSTGRPGPSTWLLSRFPEGRGEHPVTGVSWFEAMAYARFADRDLPTLFHWHRAALSREFAMHEIIRTANFSGVDTRPRSESSMSGWGAFDTAGNAREWVSNAVGEQRAILGGGYADASYWATQRLALSPWDRSNANGFRTALYDAREQIPQEFFDPLDFESVDYTGREPVADETMAVLLEQFDYVEVPLASSMLGARVDFGDFWGERVEITVGYDNERMPLFVYLPKNAAPPYQVIVLFPGILPFQTPPGEGTFIPPPFVRAAVRTGRAVVVPEFAGSFSRFDGNLQALRGSDYRNRRSQRTIRWRQDLGRAIDYVQSRDDFDGTRIAYLGFSHGASRALPLIGLEQRFGAIVLWHGGMPYREMPTIADPVNYLPMVTAPTLLVTGRHDSRFPVDTYQRELFERIGTAPENKRWVQTEASHYPIDMPATIGPTADWLDTHLGPVVRR